MSNVFATLRGSLSSPRMISIFTSLALTALSTAGALAQSTLERVREQGKITIGIHNAVPWGFRADDGSVAGFSPDLVRAAMAPLGVTEVDFVIADFGALIPGLSARRFDAIASGLYITPVRCEAVAFSDPDLSLKDAILVKAGNPENIHSYKDIADNPDLIIGAGRGSTTAESAINGGIPEDRIQQFQDIQSTVAALQAGRIHAAGFSAPTVIGLTNDANLGDLERATPFQGYIREDGREAAGYSAIAFRLEDTDLRDAYNERLSEMKADGTMTEIMTRYGFTEAENAPDLTQADICAAN